MLVLVCDVGSKTFLLIPLWICACLPACLPVCVRRRHLCIRGFEALHMAATRAAAMQVAMGVEG